MEGILPKLALLGLNRRQRQAYLHILKNKQTNLKSIMKILDVSYAGASKILHSLADKHLIKIVEIRGKKFFVAKDLNEIRKEVVKNKQKEVEIIDKMFNEIEMAYGDYDIKVDRIPGDQLIETVKPQVIKAGEVWEFIDFRFINPKKPINEYQSVKFNTLYHSEDIRLPNGKQIKIDKNKKYAHLMAYNDRVHFKTTTKETVVLENEEINNTIKILIENLLNGNVTHTHPSVNVRNMEDSI